MDIKDFILIGGGLLIAAVVAHGFWIAWRARRDPLRLDLVKDLPAEPGDDLDRLRAELPNGGARLVAQPESPEQGALPLDEGAEAETRAGEPRRRGAKTEPRLEPTLPQINEPRPEHAQAEEDDTSSWERSPDRDSATTPASAGSVTAQQPAAADDPGTADDPATGPDAEADSPANPRPKVADVIMPDRPIRADEPKEPRRWSARRAASASASPAAPAQAEAPADDDAAVRQQAAAEKTAGESEAEPQEERSVTRQAARTLNRLADRATARGERAGRSESAGRSDSGRASRGQRGGKGAGAESSRKAEPAVEELIMINVLAPKGQPFEGAALVEGLRARGLRFGDMNIFHRVDPMTRATLYSAANVVEPGTFDLSDLDNLCSPGVCLFMQLPGPEQPMETFEDMLKVARDLAMRLGGELKDEQRSVMTGQTVEHYRQRIADFCRRRMSMRA